MDAPSHLAHSRRRSTASLYVTPPRRWRTPSDDDGGWWPITFSDLVLLLLCFFVLWHVAETKRQTTAAAQAQSSLPSQLPEQGILAAQQEPLPSPEALSSEPVEQPPSPLAPLALSTTPPQPSIQAPAEQTGWQELQAQLDRYVQEHGLADAVGIVSTESGLVISLSDTITFLSGQATLSPAVTPLLRRVASLAGERPELDIEIAGHTDDRPIATAEFPSNWELSAARASRVARALLDQERLDPARVSTRGYAYYRPLYANDTDEHRAANRRVEIRFFRRLHSPASHGNE
jgi:chemotaxis protein MotB